MALEYDVKGQHTDIDIEYCGNAVSYKDNVITKTWQSLKRIKY